MKTRRTGTRIAIDASCGGIYQGGMSSNGETEAKYNLKVALELGAALEKAGYQVYYTRISDEVFSQTNPLEDQHTRTEVINFMESDITISIGLNQSTHYNDGKHGFEVYTNDNDFASYIGMRLLQQMDALSPSINLGLHKDHPKALPTTSPSIFLSLGYITDDEEFNLIFTKDFRKQLIEMITSEIQQAYPTTKFYLRKAQDEHLQLELR